MTSDTKTILILGATSGIGAAATREALARGHHVHGFARSAHDMAPHPRLTPIAGDARTAADVDGALAGADAVIYALGIRERLAMLWEKETLFSDTTRVLIAAMERAGVTRLVAVTGFGAGRSRAAMSTVERLGHRAILGRPYADKDRQEGLIMDSALDWTIVRPTILTNSARTGQARAIHEPAKWKNGLVSRTEVADYLLDVIEHDHDIRADVVLTRA
ncbi:NAD(P)-dependent oxidoreductase [Oceaniglobus indicus]|uniref:NAD(P)-dependent oxidoreductase n=1 Tax=Oceaniglobus indicus TaxID=2047749 RepID=UPI000C19AB4F|nr:NAD(P)H-binding protein [Oceaniglobus indicus]